MDALISDGTLAFGEFIFDIGAGRIVRMDVKGRSVPDALVTKDALMHEVWSSVAVEDNNLTVQITGLRKVLDAGRTSSSCIHTVTGRGPFRCGYDTTSRDCG
jgi:DNA-binding winged helix-turn-helix (wHTH) protein